ncbi:MULTISPECIES: porin [Cupriavidus]|uniref:porin n=1 Tax=Cupriavidus sp. DF5525 TaxID=3160989 RepID=UPI0006843941
MNKIGRVRFLASVMAMGATGMSAPVVFAQSSVTIYGVADTYLEYSSNNRSAVAGDNSAKSAVKLTSAGLSGPRWGLRGVEDLGGGMKALFVLESGFNIDTGTMADTSRLFNRQSFVGMESPYGRLTFGRQYTTFFDILANFTPLYYSGTYEPFSVLLGPLRVDNAVKYRIALGALTAQAHYAFGEQPGSIQASASWGGGVSYGSGPFAVSAIYDQGNGPDTAAGIAKSRKAAVAGTYTQGPIRLSAGYRWGKDVAANGATSSRDNMYWAGIGYQIATPFGLTLAYYYDDIKSKAGVANPANPQQYVLQGIYSLSKRTDVYGVAAYAKNSALNFASLQTLAPGKTNQTGVALGIRHKF